MRTLSFAALVAALFLVPTPTSGQIVWGGHAAYAERAFGGAPGVGIRLGLDAPMLPVDLMVTAENFFPDCPAGETGCSLRGLTVEGNFRMVLPLVRPYLTAGMAYRRFAPGGGAAAQSPSGASLGAGLDFAFAGVRVFGEGRYELSDAPGRQTLWRVGLLLRR